MSRNMGTPNRLPHDPEQRALYREALAGGWEVIRGTRHTLIMERDGQRITIGLSATSHASVRNTRGKLRR